MPGRLSGTESMPGGTNVHVLDREPCWRACQCVWRLHSWPAARAYEFRRMIGCFRIHA